MNGWIQHEFGRSLPLDDVAATCRALGIESHHRVLEVGGGGNGFSRANVVCDLTFGSSAQRNGAPASLRPDVCYVEASVEKLPFNDHEFDFVYCTQVLEHVIDPVAACRELSRVAKRGFVEVPNRFGEALAGNPTHRWIVDREGETLVFTPRSFVEHPLRNLLYGFFYREPWAQHLLESRYRDLINHQVVFAGQISGRVVEAPRGFDYEDPRQAGRAHLSFAYHTLTQGADPRYAFVDAAIAARLLPESWFARLLLAHYHARLLNFDAAEHVLEQVNVPEAQVLRSLLARVRAGEPSNLREWPLPPYPFDESAAVNEPQLLAVSVVVHGRDPAGLRRAAESALTQDYPAVDVVVSGVADPAAFAPNWHFGDRLHVLEIPDDTSAGARLNRGAIACRGDLVAFLSEDETFLPHHIERTVAELTVRRVGAVYADRVLTAAGRVVSVDLDFGSPSLGAASLSTLVARRETLAQVGAFDEGRNSPALDFLGRLGAIPAVKHLKEATVLDFRSEMPAFGALADLKAYHGLDAVQVLRLLHAAFERERR